jgi:uncharacterized iron-regulated protein
MSSSLALQRSLFSYQRRQIARLVQPASGAFRVYEAGYHRATRRYRAVLSPAEVTARALARDVVYVGDYHTLRLAQQGFAELAEAASQRSGRRVVLALEFVEASKQRAVDAFVAGRLGERAFLKAIGRSPGSEFDLWPGFKRIFELARRQRLEVLAIDQRAGGPRSLERRDRFAASRIARVAAAADRPLVLVLVGQFHVAPSHLPRRVSRALAGVEREQLTIYQNAEGIWWRLARAGLAEGTRAVEIDDRQVCLLSASPVVCQRSFLDYVEAEAGDAQLEEPGLARTIRVMARELGRLTGVDVGSAARQLEVVTAADLDGLDRIARRGRFSDAERRHLQRHVLERESTFVPRARAVWLSSLSLNHAAEEATHLVRSVAVGAALEAPRPPGEAFLARAYEEALGFFGSRLLNPARRGLTLEDWSATARDRASPQQRVAVQVLALLAALQTGDGGGPVACPASPALARTTSQAFGVVLGGALARGFSRGRVSRAQVRALFRDRLRSPVDSLRTLVRALGLKGAPRPVVRAA